MRVFLYAATEAVFTIFPFIIVAPNKFRLSSDDIFKNCSGCSLSRCARLILFSSYVFLSNFPLQENKNEIQQMTSKNFIAFNSDYNEYSKKIFLYQASWPIQTAPPILFLKAPVTEAAAVFSSRHLSTPSKAIIKASL